jgi:hypothetical protein
MLVMGALKSFPSTVLVLCYSSAPGRCHHTFRKVYRAAGDRDQLPSWQDHNATSVPGWANRPSLPLGRSCQFMLQSCTPKPWHEPPIHPSSQPHHHSCEAPASIQSFVTLICPLLLLAYTQEVCALSDDLGFRYTFSGLPQHRGRV